MIRRMRIICGALTLLLAANAATAADLVVRCERLFDAEQSKMLDGPWWISSADGRISAVERSAPAGSDAVSVDDGSCVPGLIDLHTHITMQFGPQTYSERFRLAPAFVALRAVGYAQATLDAGFTTVRDLGDSDNVSLALRDAINAGLVAGPRIYSAAKSIATTGGHADPSNGQRPGLTPTPGPAQGVANGADQARAAVRQRYKDGADLIKITATGGVLSLAANGLNPQFTAAEAQAIVDTARDYGMTVAAHAHGKEGMRRAIEAGVTSIEHGTFMDAELMDLMKERKTWYVPTLMAGWWTATKAEVPGYYPPMVAAKARAISPQIAATLAKAYQRGVPIAFGTDSGVSPHGMNAKEFELMVEAGMSPAEALQAATWNAAQVLNKADQLGSLEVGKLADMVVVSGDPSREISSIHAIKYVIKEGVVVSTGGSAAH